MDLYLSDRQKVLLQAIINEFMDTAEAVGSIHLPEKYDLGVSPATVRNEMVNLAKAGVIRKAHASSGRIPTPLGFRYFIEELLDELDEIAGEREAQVKEVIFQNRFDAGNLMFQAAKKLNELTSYMGIAAFGDRVFYYGLSELMDFPEYQKPRRLKRLLSVLEDYNSLSGLFDKVSVEDDYQVFIGEEDIGIDTFEKAAIVLSSIKLHKGNIGYIAVIGPSRMDYGSVIPAVKWMSRTINSSVVGW